MLSDSGRRSEVSLFVCLSWVSAAESWDSFQSDSNLAGLDSLSAGNFLSTKSIQTDCYGLPVWDQFSDSSAWHMYRKHTSSATPRHLQRSIFYFWFWSLFIKIRHNWLELLERWSCREHDIDYPEQLVILWHRRQCWWWSLISGHRTNIAQLCDQRHSSVLLLLVYTIWHLWQYHHNTRPSFIISNVSSGGKIGKILLLSQLAAGAGTHSTEDCQGE